MAKFVLISGGKAVGKMTVGQELEKITGLKLLHNHETLDLVSKFFDFDNHIKKLKEISDKFRFTLFEEVAKSDLEGMIFTVVVYYDSKNDIDYVDRIRKIYEDNGGEFYYVELEADLDARLERNGSENRLKHKPSKRDLEFSKKDLLKSMAEHRINSYDGEVKYKNYLKIDNTNMSARDTAKLIKDTFKL